MSERASIPALIVEALETYSRDYCFEDSEHAIAIDTFLRGVQPMSGWINIEDEAPRNNVVVIVPGGVAYRSADSWFTITGVQYPGALIQYPVTHWMPLPEPPK